MRLLSNVVRGSIRPFAALALMSLAACPPTASVGEAGTKYGPLTIIGIYPQIPGDIVDVTAYVVTPDTHLSGDALRIDGASIEFSVADPTIARISGPTTVITARPDPLSQSQAITQVEFLREGTTTLTAKVVNQTWIDPYALARGEYAGPFPVSKTITIESQRPDHVEFSPASPIFIERRLDSLMIGAWLVSGTGERLHGSVLKWSCPEGESIARLHLHVGGDCVGLDSSLTLYPVQVGFVVFHAAAPDAMFARFPVSGDLTVSVTNPVTSIVLTASGPVRIGSPATITPSFRDAQGNLLPPDLAAHSPDKFALKWRIADRLEWSSSDPSVATVDTLGVVTGVAPGPATITAKYNHYNDVPVLLGTYATGSITISVQPSTNIITISPSPALVTVGGFQLLIATLTDATGHTISAPFTWVSQNSSILVATENGLASGRLAGISTGVTNTMPSATVDVWVRAAGALTIVPVTVYREITNIVVNPPTFILHPGEHVQLAATMQDASGNVVPNAATNLDWQSLDVGTLWVDFNGLVTAVAVNATPGRIRAQSTDGASGIANITVQALNSNPIAKILLQPTTASMAVGTIATPFTAQALDAGGAATSAHVDWFINSSAIGNIGAGGQITATGAGSSTIVAANASGDVYGQALLRVAGTSGIARIVVAPFHVFLPNPGQTWPFTVTAFDVNGTSVSPGPVTWASSDITRATVDINTGVVTAVSTGGAIITATRNGQTSTGAVTIGARGAIKGTMSSTSNQFLSGGKVSVNGVQLVTVDAATNQFYIPGLAAGSYLVSVAVDGIPFTQDFTVVVTANSTTLMPVAVFP